MGFVNPTISDFKTYFFRDFPYGTDINVAVVDLDISKVLTMADMNFNPSFWLSQDQYNTGFLLLAAHYLVMNLRASSQGLSGQFTWLESGKSAGSVSEGLSIPQRILDNPELAILSKTNYGAQYLFLLLPQLVGQMFVVCGDTLP